MPLPPLPSLPYHTISVLTVVASCSHDRHLPHIACMQSTLEPAPLSRQESVPGFVVEGMWKDLVDCREPGSNSCVHGCEIESVSWVLLFGVLLKDSSWFLESKVLCGWLR